MSQSLHHLQTKARFFHLGKINLYAWRGHSCILCRTIYRCFFGFVFSPLWFQGLHCREEEDVADGGAVGEEHDQAIHAEAEAARGGQAVLKGGDVVVVDLGLAVGLDGLALSDLALEAGLLIDGVVQLAEGIAVLGAVDEILEALGEGRVMGLRLASGLISTG